MLQDEILALLRAAPGAVDYYIFALRKIQV